MVLGSSILFHGVSKTKRFDRVLPRRVRMLIRRHGVWGVAVARLVPGLRNATVFAAASANMRYRYFAYGLIPAAVVWSGFLLLVGWLGGDAMLAAFGQFHDSPVLKGAGLALLFTVVFFVWWRLRGEGQRRALEA
jgi:membrane protein DedA with SNARE-associated domain